MMYKILSVYARDRNQKYKLLYKKLDTCQVGNVDSSDFAFETFGFGAFSPLYIEFRLISCRCLAAKGPEITIMSSYLEKDVIALVLEACNSKK